MDSPQMNDGGITVMAARWFVRRQEQTTEQEDCTFAAWLACDPEHQRVYRALEENWIGLGALADDPRVERMREAALREHDPRYMKNARLLATSALLVGLLLPLVLRFDFSLGTRSTDLMVATGVHERYHTGRLQRSTRRLPDGSVMTLNVNSVAEVAYTPKARYIALLAGEAYFKVSHDRLRPFVVHVGNRDIVALGTEFDVRHETSMVSVSLVEGKLAVRSTGQKEAQAHTSAIMLTAGQRLVIAGTNGQSAIVGFDVNAITGWRSNRLFFNDTPLADAVHEVNRYTDTPIVISEQLKGIRVSGVFEAGQPTRFVAALASLFPVEVTYYATEIRLDRKAGG